MSGVAKSLKHTLSPRLLPLWLSSTRRLGPGLKVDPIRTHLEPVSNITVIRYRRMGYMQYWAERSDRLDKHSGYSHKTATHQRSKMNAVNAMKVMKRVEMAKGVKAVKVVKFIRRRRSRDVPWQTAPPARPRRESLSAVEGGRIGVDRTERLPSPWVDHCVQVCFINALVAIRAPNLLPVCMSVHHPLIEYSLQKTFRHHLLAPPYGTSASALALALFGRCIRQDRSS